MKAYHFLKDNMKSGEGQEKAWTIGEERTIKGEVELCVRGYHSSPSWYDALNYAPGPIACLVEIPKQGTIKDTNKSVSPKRRLVDCRNAEQVLRIWACDCAERALKKAKIKDERSWNAIKVARLYSDDKATREELATARSAARAAAWSDTRSAARAAARDAAWSDTKSAAWDAAWSVAWSATRSATSDVAWSATRSATWDAEVKWQKRHLNKLMNELFKTAPSQTPEVWEE